MTNVTTALAILQTDPANRAAMTFLAGVHPGNGTGLDPVALGEALAEARAWHRERGEAAVCLELIELELGWTTGAVPRADLLVAKAELLHEELLRPDPASAALKEALVAAPGHAPALERQARYQAERANWEGTVRDLLERARKAGDRTSAPLLAAAGELSARYRPNSGDGEDHLRRSLELDPRQRRADLRLETLLREGKRQKDLLRVLESRAENAVSPDERAAAEVSAGQVASELKRPAEATAHFRKALAASPGDGRALRWMVDTLTEAGNFVELVKVYEGALRVAKRGPGELPILQPLATLHWKQLKQNDQAELYFRRIKKAQPLDPQVIEFYRQYHTDRNEIPQLLALLAQAQKGQSDLEERVRLGIEMAEISESRQQSAEKAIDSWKALLRLKAGLPQAVTALRRLYTKAEKWNALLELLKEAVEALPADAVEDRVARYLEMIPIYRDRLKREQMVTNTYSAILEINPDHEEALAAVADGYEARGQWGELIQMLVRQAQTSNDVKQTVALYHRVAALWANKLNKPQSAVGVLEKILELAPGDAGARARLKDIHLRGRSWRALLELLQRELGLLDPGARRVQLGEMARLSAEHLGDARQAIALWNDVLTVAPGDRDATAALAGLYERESRWPALAEILGRQAAMAGEESAEGCAFLQRRGLLLAEKLGAWAAARDCLAKVNRLQPTNARVMRALRDVYAQLGEFEELEALYDERGACDELCEALTALADKTDDIAARTRLLQRVADLSATRLGQPERALKAYERIAASDPQNRVATRALVGLYRDTERWARLLATFESLLSDADNEAPSERLKIMAEARAVCEHKLGSKGLAFQWCARAYEVDPTDPTVFADLVRLGEDADEWSALAALFTRRLARDIPREERLDLVRRALRIALSRLGSPADVRLFAGQLVALAPGDDEAESALEQLFTHEGSWNELAALLRARQARIQDVPVRIETLFRVAWVEEEKLQNLAAAADTLRLVDEVDPNNVRALRGVTRLAESLRDWPGVVAALNRQVALGLDDEHAGLTLWRARLEETELKAAAAAYRSYIQALDVDAISAEAVAGLERLLGAGLVSTVEVVAAAARLAPYYELTESYAKWAGALETLIGSDASPSERLAHLELLTDLYAGPLADGVAAFRAALRAFEVEPRDSAVRARLLQMASDSADLLGEFLETLRRVLARTDETGLRRELLAHVAEIEERRPGRGADAVVVYREILSLDPLNFAAHRALTRIFRDAERWAELRALLESRQPHLPELKERVALLTQIAEIDEALLDDRDHAIATLRALTELDPTDIKALRGLARLYEATERWRDLAEVLAREAGFAAPSDITELRFRRAEVVFAHLKDVGGALDLLEEILGGHPQHAGARRLLEAALLLPDYRQRAASLLEPLYEQAGDWARLVAVLEAQKESRPAIEIATRIAEIEEQRLAAPAAALTAWRQVLQSEPGSTRALAEFERLATALGRFGELAALYEELAGKCDPANLAGAADLLGRAAGLQLGRLSDRPAGIRVWRRILDLDPAHAETARPAADALEQLFTQAGDFRGVAEILRVRVDWAADVAARSDLLLRVADIEESSQRDLVAAVATYRALLDGDPENLAALGQLERIYQTTGQQRERLEILTRRVELARTVEARVELRFQIAAVLERDLKDFDQAISTILAIIDESADNGPALEALARLYEAKGAPGERLDILERQLLLAPTPDARVDVLRRVADLLHGALGRPVDALERWREVLLARPGDADALARIEAFLTHDTPALRLAAAQVLEPVHQGAADWQRLARVLEIYIEVDEDAQTRMGHRIRLAELQEIRLQDKNAALVSYGAAIRDGLSERQLPDLLDSYERLSVSLGAARTDDMVALYRSSEPDALDEGVKIRMARVVAEHAQRAGNVAVAVAYFRKVLERAPTDVEALSSLEGLYRQTGDLADLYDVIFQRAEIFSGNATVEAPLRAQLGELALKLARPDEAIAAHERVWALRPGDPTALSALDGLYEQGRKWSELVALLERDLAQGGDERAAGATHFRLAQIEANHLGHAVRATEHLAGALSGDPQHQGAVAMLEQLLADPEAQVGAADLLESIYVRANAWTNLVAIDELRLRQTDEPARRLALTQRIARIYEEQIEDLEAAFVWYGKVFQEIPTDRGAQEQLQRLAPKLGRWKDVFRLIDERLEDDPGTSSEVLDLVRLAALIADAQIGDRDGARRHYRRLLDADPGDARASAVFEAALERWEAWGELRELLDEQASAAHAPAARTAYLHRSAEVSEGRLADRERAIATLRAILDIDPRDPVAKIDLDRLLRLESRWSDLRDHRLWMLERETDPRAQDAISFNLAEIEEENLGYVEAALERYGEILARTPTHDAALAALQRMLGNAEQRMRAAEILEPHFRKTDARRKLADVLEVTLEGLDDPAMRSARLHEIADLETRLGQPERALEALGRAWLQDVASGEALAALERLAMEAKLFHRLAAIVESGAERADDPDRRAALWGVVATLQEQRLGAPGRAIEAWRAALSARLDDTDAFVALERLLAAAGRMDELADTLERHIEITSETAARKTLTKRLALLYDETLRHRDKAIAAWRAVTEIDDTDDEALDALARLYTAAGAWRSLSDVYQRQIERAADAAVLRVLRFAAARLFDDKLGEPSEAVGQMRAVLEIRPNDAEALDVLDGIFSRENQHAELLEVLDLRAGAASDAPAKDALAYRAARLVDAELADGMAAVARYREILARTPRHPGAREALLTLARSEEYRLPAIAALEPALRGQAEWAPLVEILGLRLDSEDAVGSRLEVLAEIARIQEFELRDSTAAFATWTAAFGEDPSDPAPRQALERLATGAGDFSRLARVYEDRLEVTTDSELRRALAWRLAEIHESPLGNLARAVDFLREVLDVPGEEGRALGRLEFLLRRLERWTELEVVLSREADMTEDPGAQAEFLSSLGELRLGHLDDSQGAVDSYRSALDRVPGHIGALMALRELVTRPALRSTVLGILEPLAEAREDFAELTRLYEERLTIEDEPSERALWLRRIAETYEERLREPGRALEALGRALKEDPTSEVSADNIERLARAEGLTSEAAGWLEAVLPRTEGQTARDIALRAARLHEAGETSATSDAAAERLYGKALEVDPENPTALPALEAVYRRRADVPRLVQMLERRGGLEMDPERRRAFYGEAARLHEQRGEVDAAIGAWQAVRQADEGNLGALTELARLLDGEGRMEDLVGVLEDQARFTDENARRAALYLRIGQIRATALADRNGAALAYREVLDLSPNDRVAVAALSAIEEARGDFAALEDLLLGQLAASGGVDRVTILFRLARNASERQRDPDRAINYLNQVLELEPGNRAAFGEIERLLARGERWHELVDVLEKRGGMEARSNPTAEIACRLAVAEIWGARLGADDHAKEVIDGILARNPGHIPALLALAGLAERTGDWARAASVLEQAAGLAKPGREQADVHHRAGKALAASGATTEEIQARYLAALEADSGHKDSLVALQGLARKLGNNGQLVQLLELHHHIAASEGERRVLLREIASLYSGPLGLPALAVPSLTELANLLPGDGDLQEELADALLAAGRVDEVEPILTPLAQRAARAKEPKSLARLQRKLGMLAERRSDWQTAAERFAAAYQVDPSQPAILAALGRLAVRQNDPEKARRFYRSLLLQTFDEKAAGVTKAEVYLALGRLHLAANELPKARNMFERGLESEPASAALKDALAGLPR